MANKKQKPKRKINKTNLWAIIISSIVLLAFICILTGVVALLVLLRDKPTLNLQDFEQTESSVIYDNKGEEIANLGSVIRQNAEYEELPNCLVDAFVAIEDSRFFEHGGFDLPRFTKAIFENLRTMSFGQGGSTFTMQLVKNTYFTNDETGETASRSGASGIKRKVQEISLAMNLEKYEPKQFIFESYLNKLNYGGTRNIRGIQKAAQYYFNKDVSQLNLNESAFLAGVINGPYYYSPFTQDSDGTYHIAEAQERTEEVLYQMYHHGYISKQEYDLAKTVQIKDLLSDPDASSGDGIGTPYQAYVDAVVNEVIKMTGLDPYTTTMNIYTYMNKDIQSVIDEIQASHEEDYVGFPDEYMEAASVCIDNQTGQVVAILGGRNYADGGALLLNHATEQYKQPGSSIKPILDYALAFENLGWATDHVLTDEPIYMDSSNMNIVYNFESDYRGDSTLKEAVGNSSNSCAIQTLQAVVDKMKYEYVVNYSQSLGYDFTLDKFNIQYAIGGSTCEVTPLQHAAAYAAIMNGGKYIEPHTVKRIEFTNGKSPITKTYESKQILSEEAAYLTSELMRSNVESYGGSYSYINSRDYVVYGKTGTTDWSTDGLDYGIPAGANKDAWIIAATTEYTTATWVGYEKAVKGQQSYITNDCYYNIRPQARIAHTILDACYEYGDTKPTEITKPAGISYITHILGAQSYDSKKGLAIYYSTTDDIYENGLITKTTGQIKSGLGNCYTYSADSNPIEQSPENSKATINGQNTESAILQLEWKKLENSDDSKGNVEKEEDKTVTLTIPSGSYSFAYKHKHYFDDSWIFGGIKYKADIYIDDVLYKTVVSDVNELNVNIGDIRESGTIRVDFYYGYENNATTSKKFKKEIKKDEIVNIVPALSKTSTVDEYLTWCNEYNIPSTIEIVNQADQEGIIVTLDGAAYDISKETEVKATSTFESTYKIYLKLVCTNNGNGTRTLTYEVGIGLDGYTPKAWIHADDTDEIQYEEATSQLTINSDSITTPITIGVSFGNDCKSTITYSD